LPTEQVSTPETHWDIDTNKEFKQYWQGRVTLNFTRTGTVDGVEEYKVEVVQCDLVRWSRKGLDADWGTPPSCRQRPGDLPGGEQQFLLIGVEGRRTGRMLRHVYLRRAALGVREPTERGRRG
jgi:hypothetical protein